MGSAPTFEITGDPRQSWIRGTLGGVEVTRASFKECDDPYRRELIQIDTAPEHQRQGYALALLRYLEHAEPRGPLIDSPEGMNTDAGLATVAAARRQGFAIHEFGCFRGGASCDCAFGPQST